MKITNGETSVFEDIDTAPGNLLGSKTRRVQRRPTAQQVDIKPFGVFGEKVSPRVNVKSQSAPLVAREIRQFAKQKARQRLSQPIGFGQKFTPEEKALRKARLKKTLFRKAGRVGETVVKRASRFAPEGALSKGVSAGGLFDPSAFRRQTVRRDKQ